MLEISNNKTERVLRLLLKHDGYKLSRLLRNGETGVDIIANKGNKNYWIEVIGYKQSGPARTRDFYQGFFQAISRLNEGAKKIVLALPEEFNRGMIERAKQYRIAWERMGKIFPELEIWFIDVNKKQYRIKSWLGCLPTRNN